jgi:hypothetical protein
MEWLWPCPYVLDNGHWMDPAEWREWLWARSHQWPLSGVIVTWKRFHPIRKNFVHNLVDLSMFYMQLKEPPTLRTLGWRAESNPRWQLDWVCHLARINRFSQHLTQHNNGQGLEHSTRHNHIWNLESISK